MAGRSPPSTSGGFEAHVPVSAQPCRVKMSTALELLPSQPASAVTAAREQRQLRSRVNTPNPQYYCKRSYSGLIDGALARRLRHRAAAATARSLRNDYDVEVKLRPVLPIALRWRLDQFDLGKA